MWLPCQRFGSVSLNPSVSLTEAHSLGNLLTRQKLVLLMPVSAGKGWGCRSGLFLMRVDFRQNGDTRRKVDRVGEYVKETEGSCTELLTPLFVTALPVTRATGQIRSPTEERMTEGALHSQWDPSQP